MNQNFECDVCGGDCTLIHEGTRDNPNVNVYECKNCHTKQLGGGVIEIINTAL